MGLQKEIKLDTGIYLPEAYIIIISCNYICRYHTSVKVEVFKDHKSYQDRMKCITTLTHVCTDKFKEFFSTDILNQEGVNIISQSYEWLKTLEFYKGADDAPEPKQ